MQVGTTKDQGLYNKPSAAVHPGALAAGTLPQYNTRRKAGRRLGTITKKRGAFLRNGEEVEIKSIFFAIFFSPFCKCEYTRIVLLPPEFLNLLPQVLAN